MRSVIFKVSFLLNFILLLISCNNQSSVEIGGQVWMKNNLNVSCFLNGDEIPEAKSNEEWLSFGNSGIPARCCYENNDEFGVIHGTLYNWYAVNDPRGLAPKGWHVASDSDWTILEEQLGGAEVAGSKMKAEQGWGDLSKNSIGFTALPGGFRNLSGYFYGIGKCICWWSSTESGAGAALTRKIFSNSGSIEKSTWTNDHGFYVRCVKD